MLNLFVDMCARKVSSSSLVSIAWFPWRIFLGFVQTKESEALILISLCTLCDQAQD
jgi:hypothetical protein